jgi:Uma2 family endonuclease
MSTASRRLISPQEYLAQERLAEFKSEYLRGEVFAMAGASRQHTRIKDNFAREAGVQLKGGSCSPYTSDMRVKVNATGLYTYPDMVIVCDPEEYEDAEVDTLLNPRVIVEVLSESTEKYDRGDKFGHYREIPSLQEYVLVAQDRPFIERFIRQPDDSWVKTEFAGLGNNFIFASVPAEVPMAEIYLRVPLPENPRQ